MLVAAHAGLFLYAFDGSKPLQEFRGIAEQSSHPVFFDGGKGLLTSGHWRGNAVYWNLESGQREPLPPWFSGYPERLIAVSADGFRAAIANHSIRKLTIVDTRTSAVIHSIDTEGVLSFAGFDEELTRALVRRGDHELYMRTIPDLEVIGERLGLTSHTQYFRVSADGRLVFLNDGYNAAWLQEVASGETIVRIEKQEAPLSGVEFALGDQRLVTSNGAGWVRIYDASEGTLLHEHHSESGWPRTTAVSADGRSLAVGYDDGVVRLFDVATGEVRGRFQANLAQLDGVAFAPDGKHLITCASDQTTRIYHLDGADPVASMVAFEGGGWAIGDREQRFDADRFGDDAGCHWVIGDETFALDQFKDRYYEPRLLAKILGFNDEPLRDVSSYSALQLQPAVTLRREGDLFFVDLENRGGGLGPVIVLLNGKELMADARSGAVSPTAASATLPPIDVRGDPRVLPGASNRIEVIAYNADGHVRSRGFGMDFDAPPADAHEPEFHVVVAGVSDYAGEEIDLSYARSDAEAMRDALKLAGEKLFEPAYTKVTFLPDCERPDLLAALDALQETHAADTVVIYLAGHGVTHDGTFHYLTAEARDSSLADRGVRETCTVSSEELEDRLKRMPALKQVLILDTCASGAMLDDLTGNRGVSSDQVRDLERVKDRTGMHVLAGCAADRVSYEATAYGHGLLTYSLLTGMRGPALVEQDEVDVHTLFRFAADEVPRLAGQVGGIQRPQMASPRAGNPFSIGKMTPSERAQLHLPQPRPFIVRSQFMNDARFNDDQQLAVAVDALLREASAEPDAPWVFLDAASFPDAYQLAGRYTVNDALLSVTWRLLDPRDTADRAPEVAGAGKAGVAAAIVERARELIPND